MSASITEAFDFGWIQYANTELLSSDVAMSRKFGVCSRMAKKLIAVLGVVMLALVGCDTRDGMPTDPSDGRGVETNPASATPAAKPQMLKLIGRWERPDGGYVLDVRSVDAEGKVDAGYFNPSPINVEQAHAIIENGTVKLLILLRDANYPGCTYKLTHDAQADQLFGQYYQAAVGEIYDVTFGRVKEPVR